MLGAGGIVGALLRGLDPVPTFAAAATGALVLTVIAFGHGNRAGLRGDGEALPVPPDARYDPPWLAALLACVPSTVGVSVMTAVALVFSPALAAVLAGVLVALGVLALVFGAQLVARERHASVRVWLDRGPSPRRFEG